MKTVLGIDIGGTKCAVSIGLRQGDTLTVSGKKSIPTEGTPLQVLQKLSALAGQLIASHGKPDCCGIVCGGPLDSRRGLILSPPNLPGWDSIDAVSFFESALGLPASLTNDADAGALAEWQFGAGKGCKNMIFITFGTGCGAGLILNGALYTGANSNAGECGHMRLSDFGPVGYGKAGSMEGFCSGGGIAQLGAVLASEQLQMGKACAFCSDIGQLGSITAKDIALSAQAGEPLAKRVYELSGKYLGRGLSLLIDLLNPEKIILGSIFYRSRDLLWESARKVLEKECLPSALSACEVLPAGLGEQIGDYAALSAALYRSKNR